MTRHIRKTAVAVGHAKDAVTWMDEAIALLGKAEAHLELSGHRNAAHGTHQAKLRIVSWSQKVFEEVEAIRQGLL
jgi:hypothetical protein